MINQKYCQLMAEYNHWMNKTIYEKCNKISDEERKKDSKVFFKSIHGTLNHLLWADRAWMGRIIGKKYYLTNLGEDLYQDFNKLRLERENMDQDILLWVSSLEERVLSGMLTYESIAYKKTITIPTKIAVVHMFNHQTHHRGQITAVLSQYEVDYGPTDLPVMPGIGVYL